MKKIIKRSFGVFLSAALLFSLSADFAFAKSADTDGTAKTVQEEAVTAAAGGYEEVTEIYRLYNRSTGEHFYTGRKNERNGLRRLGWVYEGVGWVAPVRSETPVYRLYNPNAGDHHYTTDSAERDFLSSKGWKDEGIGWYSDDKKETPIYREYNPNAQSGAHNFTSDKSEHEWLSSNGWENEDIGWFSVHSGYSDVNSDYGYSANTRTHVSRYGGNTYVNSTSLSSSAFSYSFSSRSDTAESIEVISDMLGFLEAGKDYERYEAVCVAPSRAEAEKIASMYDATVKDFSFGVATLSLPLGIENVMDAAESDISVNTAIMPQYRFRLCDTYLNDPYIGYQWQHEAIDSMTAWDTTRGDGAKICIIDTGCDLDHPDLAPNIKGQATFVRGTSTAEDDNGHGTHVAGIAAGRGNNGLGGAGIAPEASLYIAKAGDAEGYFQMADLLSAMNWAVAQDVDVVNMSLGGYMDGATASYFYGNVLSRFRTSGITLVAAAGNDTSSGTFYPAAFSDAVCVAASSDDSGSLAYFSNYGQTVDIVAPGDEILSTYLNGQYEYLSGTSMASPVVAGAAALIYASDPAKFGTDDESAIKLVRSRLLNATDGITYRHGYGAVTGGLDLTKIFDPSNDNDDPAPGPYEPEEPTPGPNEPEEPTPGPNEPEEPTPGPNEPEEPTDPGNEGGNGGNQNPPPGWPDDWPWSWGPDDPTPGPDEPELPGAPGNDGYYWNFVNSPSISVSSMSGYGIDIVLSSYQNHAIYVDVNDSGYRRYTAPLHYSAPGTYRISAYCSDGENKSSVTTSTCSFS